MLKEIPVSFDKINTIIHIADIHIRLYKRHQEYRECFELLYTQLDKFKNKPGTVIVVAGDINHSKIDMSPEMISLSSEFLSKLASIAPTIVIAGNHDLNLANQHRLDSLTPIIENLQNPNIHYLRDSGIYKIADVDFAVMSIIGERSNWPVATQCSSPTKIALYHGPIYNAKTDVGYTITSRTVSESDFNGFDMVLLGDIHKHQEIKASDPVIVYPGSLIQQNHGESLLNHGWVEWNVKNRSYKFHEVLNPYGYLTLTVNDDKWSLPKYVPSNARVRLFVSNLDNAVIKKLVTLIRKSINVVELTINKISDNVNTLTSIDTNEDVHNISVQNSLITQYIEQNFPERSPEFIDRILKINSDLNNRLEEDDLPHNVIWKPKLLKFDNLFSYGEGNEIDFENMSGLYGVFSANATGKTSAFDALCFALYDKTPRAFKGSHIMNTRQDQCFCDLTFEINNTTYKIVRRGERKKNGEVKVDVEFQRMESNGEWSNLTGEDRRDTNSIIRSYVGDYEDFILTNLSVQNQNGLFIDKGQTERKDLLSQFMGLTIFDRLYNMASEDIKEVYGALKRFNRDDFTQTLVDIQSELSGVEQAYNSNNTSLQAFKKDLITIQKEIADNYANKIPLIATLSKITKDELLEKQSELNKSILESTEQVKITEKNALDITEKLKNAKQQLPDVIVLNQQYTEYTALSEKKVVIDNKIDFSKMKLVNYQKKIDDLHNHEYDPKCKYCMNNVFVKDAQTAKTLYAEETNVLNLLISECEQIDTRLSELKSVPDRYNEYQTQLTKINQLNRVKLERQIEVEKSKTFLSNLEKQLIEVTHLLEQYVQNEDSIKHNKSIDTIIAGLQEKKDDVSKEISKCERLDRVLHGQIEVLKTKKNEMMIKIKEAEQLESDYDAYEHYITAVSRDGIPYQLISKIIPTIQSTTNNILSQVVDFTVEMEVDGKNINGKIIYDDNRTWPLELASGMEKFISSLAIRISLMKISSLPRSNFLIIDEGLGVLDSENLSNIFMLFGVLRNEFDFLIMISHLDSVRDITDQLIEIKRVDGYSYINV